MFSRTIPTSCMKCVLLWSPLDKRGKTREEKSLRVWVISNVYFIPFSESHIKGGSTSYCYKRGCWKKCEIVLLDKFSAKANYRLY